MPNISINKSDLEDLGISLKDILLAITKSKNSNSDVIKIKKKKKQKANKKRNKAPREPKFTRNFGNLGGNGGGSGALPRQAPSITTVVTGGGSTDKDNQLISIKEQQNYIKNQIDDFKRDNELKLITQQNQMSTFQNMNHLGLRLIYNKIDNPLANIKPSPNFRSQPVDYTDKNGIFPTYDFYDDTSRVQILEETPIPEQSIPQPMDQQTEQNDVGQDLGPIFDSSESPIVQPISFETALEQEVQKEEKKRGRPKGSKNKPKNPLTQEAIAQDTELPNTRSSRDTLINPKMVTPDRFAREEIKKQETIENFFTPRKIVNRKPVRVPADGILDTIDEEGYALDELIARKPPTPPSESKPSKSRLPIPSKSRSRSEPLIYG